MDVSARGEIHDGVRTPCNAPSHLFDLIFDRAGDGAIADVGIDLDQKIPAYDHRLGFRVVDIRGNDRPAARDFIADKFRSDVFRDTGAERLASMLKSDAGTVVGRSFERLLSPHILTNCNEFHFGSNDPAARISELCYGYT